MPVRCKADLLTLGCDEGTCSLYREGANTRRMADSCQTPKHPDGCQQSTFKGQVREGVTGYVVSGYSSDWWISGNRVVSLINP